MRLGPVSAMARIFPDLMCGSGAGIWSKSTGTCPPSTAATAGALPLNATCRIFVPACRLKYSHDRCPVLPMLEEAHEVFSGLAFA